MDTLGAIQNENEKSLKRKGLSERDAVLVSLKNKAKKSEGSGVSAIQSAGSKEHYPYGTRVDVEGPHVKKLGLHKMSVGQKVHIMGKGHVTSVSKNDDMDGKPSHRVSIQMTHLAPMAPKGFAGKANPDSMDDLDGEDQD